MLAGRVSMAEGHGKASSPPTIDEVTIHCGPSKAKLLLRGHPPALEAIGRALGMNFIGVSGRYVERENDRALWLGPDEWLLKSSVETEVLSKTLQPECIGLQYAVVDVSSMYMTADVCPPRGAFLTDHGCPLDLSVERVASDRCALLLL